LTYLETRLIWNLVFTVTKYNFLITLINN
jgi:hypothetical protein